MQVRRFQFESANGSLFRPPTPDSDPSRLIFALREALPAKSRLFLVGGYLRRCVRARLEGTIETLGDLDVIVDAPIPLLLSSGALSAPVSTNYFGGYRWHPPGPFRYVDIWRLQDHYSIRRFCCDPTIEEVIHGMPLNIDRAVIDIDSNEVIDAGMIQAVSEKRIRFDACYRYLDHIQAARALIIQRKTAYELDESVASLFRSREWRPSERRRDIESYLMANDYAPDEIADLLRDMETCARLFDTPTST